METFLRVISTPIGNLKIVCSHEYVIEVSCVDSLKDSDSYNLQSNEILDESVLQLSEYFNGQRTKFSLPLYFEGTDFQKDVWKSLLAIPFGETVSYKHIAKLLKMPSASRAVGNANNKNRHLVIVPCHRVVGSSGSLSGYAAGLSKKIWLIDHERMERRIEALY
jgi:methylated-DNA-[protein]-cysteine S-methyltransferase